MSNFEGQFTSTESHSCVAPFAGCKSTIMTIHLFNINNLLVFLSHHIKFIFLDMFRFYKLALTNWAWISDWTVSLFLSIPTCESMITIPRIINPCRHLHHWGYFNCFSGLLFLFFGLNLSFHLL